MSERMWEDMSERMPKDMSKRMSGDMSERMAKDMSERMSERMSKDMSEDMPERMSKDMSQRMSGDMPEDIAERMSKDMSERMPEDMSSERVSKDRSERMSKDMSERCQKECQKICQKECQKICQKECQKICQAECQKICRKYMCIHRSGYQEFMFAPTESCGWQLFLFYLAHCSKYCWLNFVLCKEVSLVWQPWRRLWWNVLRRSSLGLPIGLPKELSMCGATSWLLLVLSACTCAWSRLALHMLGIWCLSWKKSWRETSGMWHMKGGLFQMRRASKSWRSALQSFVLRPRFGRKSARVGDKCCAEQSHLHRRERSTVASVGLHGLHTPWDVVVAP